MEDAAREMAFRLETRPIRGPILHGPNGFSRKGQGSSSASQYYSFTRLETTGTITLEGEAMSVRGVSWMDREFGSDQLDDDQVGWDWFGLQLDDGRDLMVYRLRKENGETDFARSTLVSASGEARDLDRSSWKLTVRSTWKSPETGAVYPSSWLLEIPGENLRLEIVPELAHQENRSRRGGLHYWEGAVRIREPGGRRVGQGYAELTGYGTRNRPAL